MGRSSTSTTRLASASTCPPPGTAPTTTSTSSPISIAHTQYGTARGHGMSIRTFVLRHGDTGTGTQLAEDGHIRVLSMQKMCIFVKRY
eukprot:1046051-Rhodomonas_salina.1